MKVPGNDCTQGVATLLLSITVGGMNRTISCSKELSTKLENPEEPTCRISTSGGRHRARLLLQATQLRCPQCSPKSCCLCGLTQRRLWMGGDGNAAHFRGSFRLPLSTGWAASPGCVFGRKGAVSLSPRRRNHPQATIQGLSLLGCMTPKRGHATALCEMGQQSHTGVLERP